MAMYDYLAWKYCARGIPWTAPDEFEKLESEGCSAVAWFESTAAKRYRAAVNTRYKTENLNKFGQTADAEKLIEHAIYPLDFVNRWGLRRVLGKVK